MLLSLQSFGAHPLWPAPVALGAGIAIGWLLLWLSRRQDRANFVLQRAPLLPIKTLSDHDDAWIRGRVNIEDPLRCPHFGTACVWFAYQIEKKVTRTTTDSKGRRTTRTSWETEYHQEDAIPFWLIDETSGIVVDGPKAKFQHMVSTGTDYETSRRRHSASLLPVGKTVSAIGVKVEERGFVPYQEIPLIVTTRTPEAYLRGGDRAEWWLRLFGYVCLFLAGFVGSTFWFVYSTGRPNWFLAPLAGALSLAPFWIISAFNRFVRTRQQAEAAWRQIDVDISVRNAVIPQLVAVVEGYRKHERELFERVAGLRAGRDGDPIAMEKRSRGVSQGLLMLAERYPELEANDLYMKLHDKLWVLEEKIAASRTFYNKIAKEWNDLVQGFPTVLVAKLFGHRPRGFFRQ